MENHAIAELAKEKGNVAFKAKDYATARSLYSHAITFDRSNHLYPLNRSMANLKLTRWDEAEADATKTLVLSPHNLKALFRRGVACKELGKWDHARVDIQMFIDNGGDPTIGTQEFRSISDAESLPPPQPSSHTSSDLESGLAHLHLEDDSSPFTIHTSTTVQEGKETHISIRTDIPGPLQQISIESAVQNLSPCSCFPNPLVGIYSTNSFSLGRADSVDSGVCLKASRFNHSCSANAKASFNTNTGELRIYALGTILRGEEIFIVYTSISGRPLYGTPRRMRQALLLALYHFKCACTACSLTEDESKKSDARRVKLHELRETIRNYPTSGLQVTHLLNAGSEDFTMYAGMVCALHSDWVSAKVAEYGEDSTQAAEVRGAYLDQRSFPYAGLGPPKKFPAIRLRV
ncbi:hypothetical protein EI94DRAFT_1760925 [Lactarius quietus]|nr:hypothetical protein EI94DRAFT_1760925 [Lactarius quietus]